MRKIATFASAAVFAMLFTFIVSPQVGQAATFSDVPSYAKDQVEYLVSKDVVRGIGDGKFGSDRTITRVEAAVMFQRALDLPLADTPSFRELQSHPYAPEIAAVEKEGIIQGFPDGTFKPNEHITRAQVAAMLKRAFDLSGSGSQAYFHDVKSYHWAAEDIHLAAALGVLNGYPGGEFKPDNDMSRVEFAVALARGMDESFRTPPEQESVIATLTVNATNLNVRTGPGTSYNRIGSLPNGTVVDVYAYTDNNWAKIRYNGNIAYVSAAYLIQYRPPATSGGIKNKTIVIDAGHGGHDPGAVGNNLQEKTVNLDTALRLEKKLKAKGAKVVMTRKSDTYLSLSERVAVANKANGDAFVSIHANAAGKDAHGTETYYYSASVNIQSVDQIRAESQRLANAIQKRLIEQLGMHNRGTKHGNFHVLRENKQMPSALVELGFITNKSDAEKLGSASWRDRAAEAIALGIEDFFNGK